MSTDSPDKTPTKTPEPPKEEPRSDAPPKQDAESASSSAKAPKSKKTDQTDKPDAPSKDTTGNEATDSGHEDGKREGNSSDKGAPSKRRRRSRKPASKDGDRSSPNGGDGGEGGGKDGDSQSGGPPGRKRRRRGPRKRKPEVLEGPPVPVQGLVEISTKGFGFVRLPEKNFAQDPLDAFITPDNIRKWNLRNGHQVIGTSMKGARGPQFCELESINGEQPDFFLDVPAFEELKAINPDKRLGLETTKDRFTTRVIDMMAPIGRGQRGLIVAPPRTGKTTLLQHIGEAILENHEDMHLMVLLIDERPEEVTEFRRSLPDAEHYASSNDSGVNAHTRTALFAIERARRLVEMGKDVVILLDSITRLARSFNQSMKGKGRKYSSGGLDTRALELPRRIFASARNIREGGSLTILGTALIQTGSKMDEAIFLEFKGTGNMELVLDRKIAEHYVYPAVDIFRSGTRREELILPPHWLSKIAVIRRGLSGHKEIEAIERLLSFCERFPSNAEMLTGIPG